MNAKDVDSVMVATELKGSVGVYALNLISGLVEEGVRVTVVSPQPQNSPVADTIAIPETPGRARLVPQAIHFARAVHSRESKYSIVHFTDARYSRFVSHDSTPVVGSMHDYYYAPLSWRSTKEVRHIYQDWRIRQIYYNMIRAVEKPAIRNLDGTICITEAVRQAVEDNYNVPSELLTVIPHGINFPPVTPLPANGRKSTILFIGGNFQRKGLRTLIEAAPVVLERIPDIRFIIAGDSRDSGLMQRYAESLMVRDSFEFVGNLPREQVFSLLQTSAIFTMPSIIEAFGIPYLEAMHCGTPVVASDCPGPSDFLKDRWNSLTPRAGDSEQLAESLIEVYTNSKLRESLVRHGYETAAKATTKRMVDRTISAYSYFRSGWEGRLGG